MRAEQAERAFEREEDALVEAVNTGEIGQEEFLKNMRLLRDDLAAAYEEDRQDALREVDSAWGRW